MTKIRISKEKFLYITVFIIPFTIRMIPETLFPYPIGFDTPIYFYFSKYYLKFFRLFNIIAGLLLSIGLDVLVVMKYLPPLVYGFLGISIYRFSQAYLGWSKDKSLYSVLALSLSLPMLRMSWDMHKLTLGIALILITLSYSRDLVDRRSKIIYYILSILTLLTHELIAIIYLSIHILNILFSSDRDRANSILIAVTGLIIFLGIWYGDNIERVYMWILAIPESTPFSNIIYELNTNLTLFLKMYLLMIPFILYGFFSDRALNIWTGICLIGSFSTLILPSFMLGGVLPWRYILLAIPPFSLYLVNGLSKLFERARVLNLNRYTMMLLAIILLNIPTISFLGLFNGLEIYYYPGVIPENMVQTSIPLYDIEPTINLLKNVEKDSYLIVYGNFIGWARYYTDAEVYTVGGIYTRFTSIEEAIRYIEGGDIYLLWWNSPGLDSFKPLYREGNLILYKYMGE